MSNPVSVPLPQPRIALDNAELTTNSLDDPPPRSWGWVAARPSEHLIVYRGGKLAEGLCGQGMRFFKWPSDTYVIIPTTLKEVVFHANQITTDLVDVRVRGMVLYRIAQPHVIYRLINFSDRPQAEAKLAQMISDMCRSMAKWLVANLRLEDCIRRRKEEIATTLKNELSSVASERWGVEIVTIDIQDVFVQDEALFQSMQAAFRAEKEREARLARLEADRLVEEQRLTGERGLEKERHGLAVEKAQREASVEMTKLEIAEKKAEQQHRMDRQRAERAAAMAREELERSEANALLAAGGKLERARLDAQTRQAASDEETRALRERLAAESSAGRASLERLFLTDALPKLATALAAGLQNARLHLYQGEAGTALLPSLVRQVLDVMRSADE